MISDAPRNAMVMKYIRLVYLVENDMNAMSKKEADACVEESCPPPTAPFGETKEQLGGFLLIKAGDPNEAIQVPRRSDGPRRQHRGAADQEASPVRRMR